MSTLGKMWSTRMSSGLPWLPRFERIESLNVWDWSSEGIVLYDLVGELVEERDACGCEALL